MGNLLGSIFKLTAETAENETAGNKTAEIAENEKWDIMVSYNWRTGKECANDLYKVLTKNGYKVWIDDQNMGGDLGREMARGVANSTIVLLLISEEYENSHNCEREYTLADQCRKIIIPIQVKNYLPPDSSKLALIIAGKMYYKLYENKEENMKRILKEIENHFVKRFSIKGTFNYFYKKIYKIHL